MPSVRTRDELGDIWSRAWGTVHSAQRRVDDHYELAHNAESLNAAAPNFFGLVQGLLLGDAILALCRVTDPPRLGRNERLSVKVLHESVADAPSLDSVNAAMTPLRNLRNNWISHADLETALADTKATVAPADIERAVHCLIGWLREFARHAGLLDSDSVDQGIWKSASTFTAALRDAEAVHSAYVRMLDGCRCGHATAVDAQLTETRAEWEPQAFSELEWLAIQASVFKHGLMPTLNSIDHLSPYAVVLAQAQSPDRELTKNYTDRRVAARVRREADLLLRELQRRAGEPIVGLVFDGE